MEQKNIFILWALLCAMSVNAQEQHTVNQKDTIQIVAVGDIMMGTMYPDGTYLPKNNDCNGSFSHVKPYFANADILFGNLEGALIRSTAGAKKCGNPKVCYTFGMPVAFVSCLAILVKSADKLQKRHCKGWVFIMPVSWIALWPL